MRLVLKDGRVLKIHDGNFYEVAVVDGEEYRFFIGKENISVDDIERVE